MTKKITDNRKIGILFLLCFLVYFSTYLGRLNYSASLAQMIQTEGFSKGQAGLIGTLFFFAYGAGQLISGFLGDRLPCKWLVFGGLGLSGVINSIMGMLHTPAAMAGVWCVNGLAQAFIWSPLLRILYDFLKTEVRMKLCLYMNFSVPVGTIAAYVLSAALIAGAGWRFAFFVPSVWIAAVALIWLAGMSRIEKYAALCGEEEAGVTGRLCGEEEAGVTKRLCGEEGVGVTGRLCGEEEAGVTGRLCGEEEAGVTGRLCGEEGVGVTERLSGENAVSERAAGEPGVEGVSPEAGRKAEGRKTGAAGGISWKLILTASGLCWLLFALCVQGALKDGVTTWIPTYLEEKHNLGSMAAILSTMVIPLCNLFGVTLASVADRCLGRNEVGTSALFFGACGISLIVLLLWGDRSVGLSLAMLALSTTSMMAVNTMLIAVMPSRFGRLGKASSVSGVMNSSVYAGGAVSTYGIGALSAAFGWNRTILLWVVGAAVSMALCLAVSRRWKQYAETVLK